MKRRKAYEKPSERKTREKAEAIRRGRKAARKQAQRDGLIPMPKRRKDERRFLCAAHALWVDFEIGRIVLLLNRLMLTVSRGTTSSKSVITIF